LTPEVNRYLVGQRGVRVRFFRRELGTTPRACHEVLVSVRLLDSIQHRTPKLQALGIEVDIEFVPVAV
jgi:hypothetical protein